jgi:hypothetical protein
MIAVISGEGGYSDGPSAGCGATITMITPVSMDSNLEPNYYKASDRSKKQNVRDIFGYMDVDTVVPSANGSISFTGAVAGGADGTGYWGENSYFIWNESLGGGNDQAYFCPDPIDTFTPVIPRSAGTTDCITLTVTNSQDNHATFATNYYVKFHNAAENITETAAISHPIVLTNPDFTYTDMQNADPLAGWQPYGPQMISPGSATMSHAIGTQVSVSSSVSVSAEISATVAEITAKYGLTNGTTWSITYSSTTTVNAEAYKTIQYYVAPVWTQHMGTCDSYDAYGYEGSGTYTLNEPGNNSSFAYATLATFQH